MARRLNVAAYTANSAGTWNGRYPMGNVPGAKTIGVLIAGGGSGAFDYENFALFWNRFREGRYYSAGPIDLTTGNPVGNFTYVLWDNNILPSWATAGSGVFQCGFTYSGSGSPAIAAWSGCAIGTALTHSGTSYSFTLESVTSTFGFTLSGVGSSDITSNWFCYLPAYTGSLVVDNIASPTAFTTNAVNFHKQFDHIHLEWPSVAMYNSRLSTSTTRHTPSNWQFNAGYDSNRSATFTAAPAEGATSAVLTSWPAALGTGTWALTFGTTFECRQATITENDGTYTATWSEGLAAAESTTFYYGNENVPIEAFAALAVACNIGLYVNLPSYEDGANASAGSYTTSVMEMLAALQSSYPSWTGKIRFETANEPWNADYLSYRMMLQFAAQYGFASTEAYMAYRMHAVAQLGRTYFPSTWGTQALQHFAWQVNQALEFYNFFTALAALGTPSADIQNIAVAPYITPAILDADTVAEIQAKCMTAATTAGLSAGLEATAIVALSNGVGQMCYEANIQWNSMNQSATNMGAAIMDFGTQPVIAEYLQQICNSGITGPISWSTAGCSGSNAATSPLDEFSNDYAALVGAGNGGSPTLAAIQAFQATPFVPTRNVLNGTGSTIPGGNYFDQNGGAYPTFSSASAAVPPKYNSGYYLVWFFNNLKAGTYTLWVNANGTGTTNVQYATLAGGVQNPVTSPVSYGGGVDVNLCSITLPVGCGYILLGTGSNTNADMTGIVELGIT